MISQFKTVKRNTEFLLRLNNWVIHTSSISGAGNCEGASVSEAGGEECGDAITPLIWLYETSHSEGSSARKVDNGVAACFDLYQIISFISVMTHIAGEGGRVSCLLPHNATIAMLHVAWSGGSLLCSPICWLLLIYFLIPARTCLTKSVLPETGIRRVNRD